MQKYKDKGNNKQCHVNSKMNHLQLELWHRYHKPVLFSVWCFSKSEQKHWENCKRLHGINYFHKKLHHRAVNTNLSEMQSLFQLLN